MLLVFFLVPILAGVTMGVIVVIVFSFFQNIQIRQRLSIEEKGSRELAQGNLSRIFMSVASSVGRAVIKVKLPILEKIKVEIERNFTILGKPYINISPYLWVGIQIMAGLGLGGFLFFYVSKNLLFLLTGLIIGFYAPIIAIKNKVKSKYEKIFSEMPDILDLLTLMVEAGLDFSNAVHRLVQTEKGELVNELAHAQEEAKLGKSRIQALIDMSKRVNFPPLTNVINSVTLSLKTGSSMAPTLRSLSEQFRVERTQMVEKLAAKAPTKLMFPLIMFIFPTIFIVIFGPVILSFIYNR
ncbi:MAG: type II secretion system F family protein [Elusimicrobiota bacterium]